MGTLDRFTGRSEDYDRYRQRYPAGALLPFLRTWCQLSPEMLVADVGAGTGMLAEVFLQNGNSVVAIEPNREMRERCAHLVQRWPRLSVQNATAEATQCSDHSIDIVSAGRAFHWFDTERALTEFQRILKPQGWVVLVAAGRSKNTSEQAQAYEQLLIEYGTDYEYVRHGYRIHEDLDMLFRGGTVHRTELHDVQTLRWEELVGQTMSLSMVPRPGHAKHDGMMQALRQYFDRYSHNKTLSMPVTCWLTCAQFPHTLP